MNSNPLFSAPFPSESARRRFLDGVLSAVLCALAFLLAGAPAGRAAGAGGTGTIEGRVLNVASRSFIAHAQITIEGTSLVTFTDDAGEYRLSGVPAGSAHVRAFFTGLDAQTAQVNVAAGARVRQDFELGRDEAVKLAQFVVAANRDYNAQSIAINEQRFAPNVKSVIAGDEFGDVSQGNFGVFLKFVPGVAIIYSGDVPSNVSVRGVPPENTPVTIDGNASTSAGLDRAFPLEQLMMNDIARVEVTKTPTPDMSANSLGGAVNVVTKSAFEQERPVFRYKLNSSVNSGYAELGRKAGPNSAMSGWRVRPGGDFSYIVPLSKTFGFTLSAFYTARYQGPNFLLPQWSPVNTGAVGTASSPALIGFRIPVNPAMQQRWSLSASADWKPTPRDVVRVAVQHSSNLAYNAQVDQRWAVGANPTGWGPDFTQGRAGMGTVTYATTGGVARSPRYDTSAKWTHSGDEWKLEIGVSYSRSEFPRRDLDDGLFASTTAVIRNLTVGFRDIQYQRPGTFAATTATGGAIDINDSGNATLNNAVSTQTENTSAQATAHIDLRRDFRTQVPFTLRVGALQSRDDRDTRVDQRTYTFVGPDNRANTADDTASLYDLAATEYSKQGMPWGLAPVLWPSNDKLVSLFRQHPEYFSLNEVAAITAAANNSRKITETVSAAYLRADTRLLENRLWLVGGVRYEGTKDDGFGVLNDPTATFQRDAQGRLLRDARGNPVAKPGSAADLARLQYTDRGAHAERDYGSFYPSLNATFNLRENLLLRAAWARTLGRPNFGEIVPGVTVSSPTAADPTITVNNTGLKPWTADNFDLSLEFYPTKTGLISVSAFQKNIADFFGATRARATPEFLSAYGLDPSLTTYDVVSETNVGDARVTGFEYNLRQSLDGLHPWLRGVSVFVNGTEIHLSGPNSADFRGFTPHTVNWGIAHSGKRHTVRLNWNYTGRHQDLLVESGNTPPDTFRYTAPWMQLDVSAEYRFSRRFGLYIAVRNFTNAHRRIEQYAPSTPDYARLYQEADFGAMWDIGIKGSF
jgi:TonB-dependent receptor